MNKFKLLLTSLILTIGGMLFSGYLAFSKLILGVCSLGESCPYLFGYPVCVFGFMLFFTLFLSILSLLLKKEDSFARQTFFITSIIGVLFSGYYAYVDIFTKPCIIGCGYTLGLPSCVYGFIVFVAVFMFAKCYYRKY